MRETPRVTLSDDARDELQLILGDPSTDLLSDLTVVVHRYRDWHDPYASPPGDPRPLRASNRAIDQLRAALRHLIDQIDRTDRGTRARLDAGMSLVDLATTTTTWGDLQATRERAAHALRRLPATRGQRPARRRGRPPQRARALLATAVALVLRAHGVRVTSGRGGVFDGVMSTMVTEVDGRAPIDLFRSAP